MTAPKRKPVKPVTVETVTETVEVTETATSVIQRPTVHVVTAKDTLSSIAEQYCPENMDVNAFIVHLNLKNNRPTLFKGMVINL